jgi:hypothetical protein
VLEGMAEQLVEVVGADIMRVVAKGRDARVNLLGPLLVRLDDGQGVQLCVGCVFARGVTVQPAVNVDARPLRLLASVHGARGQDEHEHGSRTEEPASRTTPYRPTAHVSSAHCGMRGGIGVRMRVRTLSHDANASEGRGPAAMPSA